MTTYDWISVRLCFSYSYPRRRSLLENVQSLR